MTLDGVKAQAFVCTRRMMSKMTTVHVALLPAQPFDLNAVRLARVMADDGDDVVEFLGEMSAENVTWNVLVYLITVIA